MFKRLFNKLLDLNQKEIDRLQKIVEKINILEPKYQKLKDGDFTKKTEEFKKQITKGKKLEDILPEAFAMVREAAFRTLDMRLFDVQMIAASALFEGNVAEQKTGEGKTLSAVPALYLRALSGKGAHLVTVNDYLARRDAGWNAPVFKLLGMDVGVIIQETKSFVYDPKYNDSSFGDERLSHLRPADRREAYKADITYGTNNEFGFDYLRDNMVQSLKQKVQRGHYFAIIDEVDSVLIDEARTPLIISAPDTEPTSKYYDIATLVSGLSEKHFEVDEKQHSATLTEEGIDEVEKALGVDNLYEKDFNTIHHIENALKARTLYRRDKEYVVKDGKVIIVDEFTGRMMPGRRWSDGLHQAVEAKEGIKIQQESRTMATISFQNYFRLYENLSGMTGTAATEAEEFNKIYGLGVVVVPTNEPIVREDNGDLIYKTLDGKFKAVVAEIQEKRKTGQPVLVGTVSIEKNEMISKYLKRAKIPHNILNAKNHLKEALIVANAGKPGAVTVATNMAGRGVDIVLGGAKPDRPDGKTEKQWKESKKYKNWAESQKKVLVAGGLHVIGTERHESRRIDNQLRGRSGRQGDPGSTRFYLSLEDDLMRIFGGDRIQTIMNTLKLPEDMPIENKMVSKSIEQAQVKVEGFHFDSRKRVVEFDDVANQQREVVYGLRNDILGDKDVSKKVREVLLKQIDLAIETAWPTGGRLDAERLVVLVSEMIPLDESARDVLRKNTKKIDDRGKIIEFLTKSLDSVYKSREKLIGKNLMKGVERFAYLGAIDKMWVDHLDHIENLRQGIGLRQAGGRDALVEFKGEAFTLFEGLLERIDEELARRIFRVGVTRRPQGVPLDRISTNVDKSDGTGLTEAKPFGSAQDDKSARRSVANLSSNKPQKVGRNDPCPCGSGKKWKKCGLINAQEHKG